MFRVFFIKEVTQHINLFLTVFIFSSDSSLEFLVLVMLYYYCEVIDSRTCMMRSHTHGEKKNLDSTEIFDIIQSTLDISNSQGTGKRY